MIVNKNKLISNQRGYIALMSAIVISAILMMLVYILSFTSLFARFNILDAEFKKKSLYLAEACVDVALLKLAGDNTYRVTETPDCSGGEDIVVAGSDKCKICSVALDASQYIIITQGIYPKSQPQRSFTNIKVIANSDLSIASWQETP